MASKEVEVKPYGTSEHPQIPKEVLIKTKTEIKPSRGFNVDLLKNPLTATLVGMTIGLILVSLYSVRPSTWSWPSWMHHKSPTQTQIETKTGEMYETGKDSVEQARDKASGMYTNLKEKVQSTGESIYNTAVGGSGGSGYTVESGLNSAQQAACNTAERVRDIACNPSKYKDSMKESAESAKQSAMDTASSTGESIRKTADDAASKASGIYETAKQKASEMFDAAKHTVTYPLHSAQDAAESAYESAKGTMDDARDKLGETRDAAKDTARSAFYTAGDTVTQAKDKVVGAGEAVKDTIVGAGESAKNAVGDAFSRAKDTVTSTGEKLKDTVSRHDDTRYVKEERVVQKPGQTKIKVEVQDA